MIRRILLILLACLAGMSLVNSAALAEPVISGPLIYATSGDSYTSGIGADKGSLPGLYVDNDAYDPATTSFEGNSCFRSSNSYANVAARELGYQLVDMSCASAEPRHILDEAQFPSDGQGVQIDAVPANADKISIGIGGNPAFGKIIMETITKRLITTDSHVYQDVLSYYRDVLPSQLVRIYNALHQKAPGADVYAVGYPPILPFASDISTLGECNLFVDGASIAPLRAVLATLNASVKWAAEQTGTVFVDLFAQDSPWMHGRHDMCAPIETRGAWHFRANIPVNAADLAKPEAWLYGMFHPTSLGQQLTGLTVAQAMTTS